MMSQNILVFIEVRQGSIKKPSLEALGAARSLANANGGTVAALCVGEDVSAQLASLGADTVLVARHDLLASYTPDGYALTLAQAVQKVGASIVLASATAMGRDFAPRAAARLKVGLAQDCTEIRMADGRLECLRPIYAGKAFARVRLSKAPAFATLRPNVFPAGTPDAARTAAIEAFTPDIAAGQVKAHATGTLTSGGQKIELTEANIIVSGGRGIKGPEHFPMVQALANAMGGAMGASRAAVDAGWIDHSYQVGQTGKTVSPTLYVACGISGAIQHLAGMSSSKYIVAINKDPEAPIFKIADYGIVGDVFQIVPALTEEIKKLKS
jgi:electron transfer flavoprotein alpha subunit